MTCPAQCCEAQCTSYDRVYDIRTRQWGAAKCGFPERVSNGTDIPKFYKTEVRFWRNSFYGDQTCTTVRYPVSTGDGGESCEAPDGTPYADCYGNPGSDCAGGTTTDTPTRTETVDDDGVCQYVQLSDEDTTGAMMGRADSYHADAPWINCFQGSSFIFPDNETAIGYGETQIRAHHGPNSTCYMKLWYRADFTPVDSAETEIGEWVEFYEWNGTGNPCYDGASYAGDRAIVGPWLTIPPPDVPGGYSIWVLYSCVPGALPDDVTTVLAGNTCLETDFDDETGGANGLTEGLETSGSLTTGSLTTGSLTTSGVQTGTIQTGVLQSGSTQTGALSTGSLQSSAPLSTGSLQTSSLGSGSAGSGLSSVGLQTGTLQTGRLTTTQLQTQIVQTTGPLQTNHLTSGGLSSGLGSL